MEGIKNIESLEDPPKEEKTKPKKIRQHADRCFICFEKSHQQIECNSELSLNIHEVTGIRTELLHHLHKKLCYRCCVVIKYFANFKRVTVSNICSAENYDDYSYRLPSVFALITPKTLEGSTFPILGSETKEELIELSSYQDGDDYKRESGTYQQQFFQCQYCVKTFNKKTSVAIHESSHRRELRRKKRSLSIASVQSKEKEYLCEKCKKEHNEDVVFKSQSERKQHIKLKHGKKYPCRFCNNDKMFENISARDWHEATCSVQFNNNDELPGPRTRSRSRLRLSSEVENNRIRPMSPASSIASSKKVTHRSRDKTRRNNENATTEMSPIISTSRRRGNCSSSVSEIFRPISACSKASSNVSLAKSEPPQKRKSRKYKTKRNVEELTTTFSDCESDFGQPNSKTLFTDYHCYNKKSAPYKNVRSPMLELPNEYSLKPTSVTDRIKILHQISKTRREDKDLVHFRCSETLCSYISTNIDDVVKHEMKSHDKLAWFTCNACPKTFTNKNLLDNHRETVHFTGPKLCQICCEIFNEESSYNAHVERHSRSYFPCPECDLHFVSAASLQHHVKSYKEFDKKHSSIDRLVQRQINRISSFSDDEEISRFSHSDNLCTVDKESMFDIVEVTSLSDNSRPSTPYNYFTDFDDDEEHTQNMNCYNESSEPAESYHD